MVSSSDFLRAPERPTAIATLNRQRHLTPSCGELTPTAERTAGLARISLESFTPRPERTISALLRHADRCRDVRFRNRPEVTVGCQTYHYNVFWNSFANALSSFSLRSEIAQYALSPFLQLTILNPLAGPVETGRASPLGKEMAVRLMMWRRRL